MPAAEFIIRPNSACNDGSWRWVFASLVVVALAIAIRFAALGLWMVVPFTLAEILALGLGLWVMLQRSYTEKVLVGDRVVEIRHLQKGANRVWQLPRRRTQVKICDRPSQLRGRWYPCRLILGHAGQWVEVGGCLTDPERRSLARALRAAGIGS